MPYRRRDQGEERQVTTAQSPHKVPPKPRPRAGNIPPARFPQEPPFRNPSGPAED